MWELTNKIDETNEIRLGNQIAKVLEEVTGQQEWPFILITPAEMPGSETRIISNMHPKDLKSAMKFAAFMVCDDPARAVMVDKGTGKETALDPRTLKKGN